MNPAFSGSVIVSLAGVFMNLLLAIVFSGLFVLFWYLWLTQHYDWLQNGLLVNIAVYGVALNLTLAVFNLLPVYPLDGYHIFELIFARRLPIRVFLFLRRYGQFILIGLLILFRIIGISPIRLLSDWVISQLDELVHILAP